MLHSTISIADFCPLGQVYIHCLLGLVTSPSCNGLFDGTLTDSFPVVVFSPQIIQNFQRNSADALSIQFIIIWLLGDVFNILGAVLQGVLPTMVRYHLLA